MSLNRLIWTELEKRSRRFQGKEILLKTKQRFFVLSENETDLHSVGVFFLLGQREEWKTKAIPLQLVSE